MTIQVHIDSPTLDAFVVGEGSWGPASIRLHYDAMDPYAVSLTVMDVAPCAWTFGRELLLDGIIDFAGEGDVVICPAEDSDELLIEMRAADSHLVVRVGRDQVWDFLESTCLIVPPGTECRFLNIDDAITRLLKA